MLTGVDVGGGATAEAIKQAFELITSDPKVTCIFVNIFGGIVRCDAIAQGLIAVVESMNLRIPIIARLQGTNMEKAHKMVSRHRTSCPRCWTHSRGGLDQRFGIEDLLDRGSAECGREIGPVLQSGQDG